MTSFSEEAEPGDGARAGPPYHSASAAPPTDNRIRENVKLNYDHYMVIDIDEVHLPERNLNQGSILNHLERIFFQLSR